MRRELRPHGAYTKRPRPIRRLLVVVLALAAAGALAVTGIALGAGSSTTALQFSPANPHGVFTSGRLYFGTRTEYTDLTRTTRIQLQLDDDFQFTPNAFPKCNPAAISGDMTMQEALEACGPAAGAAKNAWLWPATGTKFSNGQAQFNLTPTTEFPTACVLVFNGSGATSEVLLFIRIKLEGADPIDCGAPQTNTDGHTSFLVRGDLKANPAIGGDYRDPDNCSAPDPRRGCQIDLINVSDGPLRLTQLNVRIRREGYLRARCVDPPAGNRQWNLRGVFTYATPAGTQTATKSQTCT
jgi:hypothetical protein